MVNAPNVHPQRFLTISPCTFQLISSRFPLPDMNPINLFGYSERGMVNALCYEMRYSVDGLRLLREFLNLLTFPHSQPDFADVQSATFIVEQSFSDFGDLDLLILLDGSKKQAVFLEAKVKTSQANDWSIVSQWAAFRDIPKAVAKTSNLFMQLYRKMRLVHQLQFPEEKLEPSERALKSKLGQNPVVNAAAERLRGHCSDAWFVSLVPDDKTNARRFFEQELTAPVVDLPHWDHRRTGFLSWDELEKHCRLQRDDWPHTLANFEYNKGQIHGSIEKDAGARPPAPGSLVTWVCNSERQAVAIKRRGRLNTRVVLANRMTKKVPNSQLH